MLKIKGNEMDKRDILQPFKKSIALVLLLGVFFNLSHLVYPIYMLQVYEKVLTSFSKDTLIYLILLAAVLTVLGAIIDSLRKSVLSGTSLQIKHNHLAEILSRLSLADRRNNTTDSYTGDLEQVTGYISGGTINTLLDIIWSPLFLIALFFIHPYLGAVGTIAICAIIISCFISEHYTQKLNKNLEALSNQYRQAEQHYSQHYDALLGSALSEHYNQKTLTNQEQFFADKIKVTTINNRIHAVNTALKNICQILVLGTGAALVIDGLLTPGLMIVGTIIYGRAIHPFGNLVNVYQQSNKAMQAYKRLNTLIQQPLKYARQKLQAENGHLRVEKLVVTLPDKKTPIIKGISFELNPGSALALYGNSRSGKSTLLRAIAGIWHPSNGTATVNNINTASWARVEFAQSIGYLGQDRQLLPGTIKENIAQFADADDENIYTAARLAGVHHYILELPQGYDTKLTGQNIHLSHGSLQLIAIARALFASPRLLLLDEPFSCLSFNMKKHLLKSLQELHQNGVTMIIATSTDEGLQFTDKRMILSRGVISSFNHRKTTEAPAISETQSAMEQVS
jgi:PrtD family type I secretion system ABC transporter